MNIRIYKNIFISLIIFLIIAGIYIIYIKDNGDKDDVQARNKETITTKEITIGITEFDTINPILTKSLEMQHLMKLVYEPLVNISQDFKVEPAIAVEWPKIDSLTYIVRLDDSKDIQAKDIIFTINLIKQSASIYKNNIQKIDRVEEIDEKTLKIYLSEEVQFFEYLLCFPILKEEGYNQEAPKGIGKYNIQSITKDEIILKGQETKLTVKILSNVAELYNEFTRENIDLIITQNINYEEYIGNIGFEENIIIGREFYYISCENIKNKETRLFIKQAINKEKIVYDLYNKRYVIADFPLEYGSYLNKENETEKDEIILKNRTFTLSVEEENYKIAEKIKEQLEEKGIKIVIQNYKNSYADLILKKHTVPITPSIKEYFKDKEIKEQIDKIVRIENKEIIKQEYKKIIDNYYEEMPFISLYFNSYIILHNNKLKGDFSGNWYNVFYNVDSWYKIL